MTSTFKMIRKLFMTQVICDIQTDRGQVAENNGQRTQQEMSVQNVDPLYLNLNCYGKYLFKSLQLKKMQPEV